MAMTLECTLHMSLYGQIVELVRHYHSPTAAAMPDAGDFVQELADAFDASLGSVLSENLNLFSYTIREAVLGAVGYNYTPTAWPGTGGTASSATPSFVAVGVILRGAPYSSPPRGFARLAGGLMVEVEGNQWSSTYLGFLQSNVNEYFGYAPVTGGGAGAWLPVIYSRKYDTVNPIVQATASPYLYHQTSRHVGHGV